MAKEKEWEAKGEEMQTWWRDGREVDSGLWRLAHVISWWGWCKTRGGVNVSEWLRWSHEWEADFG